MDTTVVLRGNCLYVYLEDKWPPKLPPIVKACPPRGRAAELYKFLRQHGRPVEGAEAVVLPTWCVYAASALAIMLYAAEFDRELAYELCNETPATFVSLITEAGKWSRSKSGPLIAPRHYSRLAKAMRAAAEVYIGAKRRAAEEYVEKTAKGRD
ncbi:MAG: hypothetical protein ACO2PM_16880 [Pyrobaculum sp.]